MRRRNFTFDTGALIALERRKQRMVNIVDLADSDGAVITVPSVVVCEWWKGRTDAREKILEVVSVEPLSLLVAKTAGQALSRVARRPGDSARLVVDAVVVASAALRADDVFTSDVDDLGRFLPCFPGVRLLSV